MPCSYLSILESSVASFSWSVFLSNSLASSLAFLTNSKAFISSSTTAISSSFAFFFASRTSRSFWSSSVIVPLEMRDSIACFSVFNLFNWSCKCVAVSFLLYKSLAVSPTKSFTIDSMFLPDNISTTSLLIADTSALFSCLVTFFALPFAYEVYDNVLLSLSISKDSL